VHIIGRVVWFALTIKLVGWARHIDLSSKTADGLVDKG
jgi:hypothetical protein